MTLLVKGRWHGVSHDGGIPILPPFPTVFSTRFAVYGGNAAIVGFGALRQTVVVCAIGCGRTKTVPYILALRGLWCTAAMRASPVGLLLAGGKRPARTGAVA